VGVTEAPNKTARKSQVVAGFQAVFSRVTSLNERRSWLLRTVS
jgi:hypothetical protein